MTVGYYLGMWVRYVARGLVPRTPPAGDQPPRYILGTPKSAPEWAQRRINSAVRVVLCKSGTRPARPTGRLASLAGLLFLLAGLAGASAPALAGDDQWSLTGGPPGLVYAVAVDPLTEGAIYAGTSTAGVFKSADGGQTWKSASEGLAAKAVFSLALDPSHAGNLYAGTNRGVYRSVDAAASWTEASKGIFTDPFGSSYVYSLVIDPGQASVIYAGTLIGLFKSQDGGQTWEERNTGLRIGIRPAIEALAIDPQNTGILYAGAGYGGSSSTLFKSQDGGDSWVPLTVGLRDALVSSIAVSPQEPGRVYIATRGQGAFASSDSGLTWQQVGIGVLETQIAAVAVSSAQSMVFAAGMRRGFYRSADGGRTWEETGERIGERSPSTLALDPRSNARLWLGATGGLYKSDDRGSHWSASGTGVDGAQVVAVTSHPYDANKLLVSAWAGGVYQTNDGGVTWQAAPLGVGIASAVAMDPGDPNLAYAGMVYLSGIRDTGLYLSRDGGGTWQAVPRLKNLNVSGIATVPGRAYVSTEAGLYVSEDSGSTWRLSDSGLPLRSQVTLVATHPKDYSLVYLTLDAAPLDLFRSRDSGQTWSLLHRFGNAVSIIAPSPSNASLLYAVTDSAILRSGDGGETWQEFPFPRQETIFSLAPHPAASDTLYLGTNQGSYRSLDGGRTWNLLGLAGEAVAAIAVSPADPSRVYGGTMGRGLWTYTAVPSLRVEPGRLAFLMDSGAGTTATAPLDLHDESGGSFGWAAQVASPGPWLTLSPTTGASLPMSLTLTANPTGLAPGLYQATVTVTSTITGTRNSPWQVTVTLSAGPVSRQFLPLVAQRTAGW